MKVSKEQAAANREEIVHQAARLFRERGFDGIVCGHIHHAEIRDIDGVTYYNTGDWVESCTALVEHADGRMEILDWSENGVQRSEKVTPIRSAAAG